MSAKTRKNHKSWTKRAHSKARTCSGSTRREFSRHTLHVTGRAAYLPRRARRGA